MHEAYGGVVPELASRDHVRRVVPLAQQVLARGRARRSRTSTASPTRRARGSPARCWSARAWPARWASRSASRWSASTISKGTCCRRCSPIRAPAFPFVALLVSGGHSQLFEVAGVGRYRLLGDTLDDAAGEAFDKTAKLLGLPIPAGRRSRGWPKAGAPARSALPRPMLDSGDLDMSFSAA